MPTREELHKLIDSMHEGAFEAAHRALSNLQIWPPPSLPDMETIRKRHEQHREEMKKRIATQQRPGTISGFGGSGNYNPTTGSGSHGMSHWEGDTFIAQTYRQHQGHELMVIERIRVDGQRLIYKHEVAGPGEKRDEREIIFDLPQAQAHIETDDHS
jgi:hypothetical protein